jgi:hypothetical protein
LDWDSGLATPGTWNVGPDRIVLFGSGAARPGDLVQRQHTQTGAMSTGTTVIPYDDTIPQNTEGDQYFSLSITPTAKANLLAITGTFHAFSSASAITTALFQDSSANALAVSAAPSSGGVAPNVLRHTMIAAVAVAMTMKVRIGSSSAGTLTLNGVTGVRRFGGVIASHLTIEEIMA